MNKDFIDQFGDEMINPFDFHNNIVKPSYALAGKEIILLYFSAHWCPPCRQFTTTLIKLYQKLKRKRRNNNSVEVVFCSLDYERKDYDEYIANMPWLCMPYQSILSKKMAKKYKAKGIPHLVVIDAKNDYSVITSDAISEVRSDKSGSSFPWRPKTFQQIWPDRIHAPPTSTTEPPSKMINSGLLRDKYLMLYFSADWCPPSSRQITTPRLSEFYRKMKAERDDFELVFVSSDQSEQSFEEYFTQNMTFCALPYQLRDTEKQLSKKYQIKSIPTLLMLGPMMENGERPLINPNVRGFMEGEGTNTNAIKNEFPFHIQQYGSIDKADLNDEKCVLIFHENANEEEQEKTKEVAKQAAAKIGGDEEKVKIYWSLDKTGTIGARVRSVLNMPDASSSTKPTMILLDLPDHGGHYKSDETDITVDSITNFIQAPGKCWQLE